MKPMIRSVPRTSRTIALTEAMTVPSPSRSKKKECSTVGGWNSLPSSAASMTERAGSGTLGLPSGAGRRRPSLGDWLIPLVRKLLLLTSILRGRPVVPMLPVLVVPSSLPSPPSALGLRSQPGWPLELVLLQLSLVMPVSLVMLVSLVLPGRSVAARTARPLRRSRGPCRRSDRSGCEASTPPLIKQPTDPAEQHDAAEQGGQDGPPLVSSLGSRLTSGSIFMASWTLSATPRSRRTRPSASQMARKGSGLHVLSPGRPMGW